MKIKGTTKQKFTRQHRKKGGNHLEQERIRQKTMKGIDGGLHLAVAEQMLGYVTSRRTCFAALVNCSGVCFHFSCVLPFRCLKFDIFSCIVSLSSFWCLFVKIISRKYSLLARVFVDSCVPVKH